MAGRLIWDQEVVGSIPAIPMVLGRAQIAGNMRSLSCESKNNAGVFLLCGAEGDRPSDQHNRTWIFSSVG